TVTDWSDMRTFETESEDALNRPRLGAEGEPCAVCGAALASDQRYCLNCGTRRAEARLPFLELLARPVMVEPPPAPPPAPPPPRRTIAAFAAGAGGAALVLLGLLAGLVLAGDPEPAPVAETKPPVVNITNT